tara:strand:- start:10396 stop:10671 length:276 start_codon:yes stop_codon:yes gene_type:complete
MLNDVEKYDNLKDLPLAQWIKEEDIVESLRLPDGTWLHYVERPYLHEVTFIGAEEGNEVFDDDIYLSAFLTEKWKSYIFRALTAVEEKAKC